MISFLDLKKINARHAEAFMAASKRVIESGWFINGEQKKLFEEDFAKYCGVKHCVGVGNGLDALKLLLKAYQHTGKLHAGDQIIVPANTFIATFLAITDLGFVPIPVDPDPQTYCITSEGIERVFTNKVKAVMLVHLYGQMVYDEALHRLLNQSGVLVFEDAAQAHGATVLYGRAGTLGHGAGFSFYPGKNLGALGDAGAVTTNDEQIAQIVRTLGNYGSAEKYVHVYEGVNSRLDELQAAFLREKLPLLDADNNRRRAIAKAYVQGMNNPAISLPAYPENGQAHVWHLFVIRTKDRLRLQKFLAQRQVQTLIHYPIAPHQQEAYVRFNEWSLPVTEAIHREVLSLPISPVMTDDEVNQVIDAVNAYR